jgi:hypothetical protein
MLLAPALLARSWQQCAIAMPIPDCSFLNCCGNCCCLTPALLVLLVAACSVQTTCRKSNNFGIDFFANSQGSTVMFENVVVVETVCSAAPADALAAAISQPTLAGQPPNSVKLVPSTCVQLPEGRRCFENSLHFDTYAAEAPAQAGGGYTYVQLNTTRVCRSYVDPECLRLRNDDVEYCWQQQAQRVQPWLQPAAQHAQLSPGATAGIAVAAGACLLWAVG